MPRVDNRLLDVVVYLYPTEEKATAGASTGGSGCLISYPTSRGDAGSQFNHLYVVTNSHVVKRDGSPSVIRLNRVDGGTQVIVIRGDDWVHHEDSDIAIARLDIDFDSMRLASIRPDIFVTRDHAESGTFGEGDECLFIGRRYKLDGVERNTPAVRMGSVAIMRPEPLCRPMLARREESIAVEARSLSGFSGSPVFIWQGPPISPPTYRDLLNGGENSLIGKWPVIVNSFTESKFAFLGITWGHMRGPDAVEDPGLDLAETEKALAVNSGIMLVIPAWRIAELLEYEEVAAARSEFEKRSAP